ncbi:MAG: hypothetical protein NTW21_25885 [Verrucomicrobia bacterium]|nr:hypothetical protein [Verrucomicrobiota bacterium]
MLGPRNLGTADFYADLALANFGREVAAEVAGVFEKMDCELPRPLRGCPFGLNADARPWDEVAKEFAFVDALQLCRKMVSGAGNLSRFDYWLDSYRYLRASAHMECTIGRFQKEMVKVQAEQDPGKRKELAKTLAVPAYREMYQQSVEALGLLMQTTHTAAELGFMPIWQKHYLPGTIGLADQVVKALGEPLPADLQPTQEYLGTPRIIVPTIRGTVMEGDKTPLRIIVLDKQLPKSAKLHWRTLGTGTYAAVDFQHAARGVYTVNLPPVSAAGIEYYLEVTLATGQQLAWPATAPQLNQTVVALPPGT